MLCSIFSSHPILLTVSKKDAWNPARKDIIMSPFILLVFVLVIGACVYGYMTYRTNLERRAREKKRNQYHDRV